MGLGTSDRVGAFLKKPSTTTSQNLRELDERKFFLVGRPGPTCFIVQEESENVQESSDTSGIAASTVGDDMSAIQDIINDEDCDIQAELERLLVSKNQTQSMTNNNHNNMMTNGNMPVSHINNTAYIPKPAKYKVFIGHRQRCSCGGGINEKQKNAVNGHHVCVHLLFVLHRVLGVPKTNPLIWQVSLTERELDEALKCESFKVRRRGQPSNASIRAREKRDDMPSTSKLPPGQVSPRPLDESGPCPICYEEVSTCAPAALVHCRFSCGNYVHGQCMKMWCKHQSESEKELSCPMCRNPWGEFSWTAPRLTRIWSTRDTNPHRSKGVHYGVTCSSCKTAPIHGKRYRCLICSNFNLCSSCYHSGDGDNGNVVHAHHPFVMSEELGGLEESVERNILLVEPISGDRTKICTQSQVPTTSSSGSRDDEGGNENRAPSTSSTKPKVKRKTSNGRNPSAHQTRTLRSPPPALPSTSLSVSSSLRIQRRDSMSGNENAVGGTNTTNQSHGSGKKSLSLRRKSSTSKQSAPSSAHLPDVIGLVAVGTSLK